MRQSMFDTRQNNEKRAGGTHEAKERRGRNAKKDKVSACDVSISS